MQMVRGAERGRAMLDIFDCGAVLFESAEDEETLRVECTVTREGSLRVLQESDGPLTAWCFEETPHRIEAEVSPEGVQELLAYFHVDKARMLPLVLRVEYSGYDCFLRLRKLVRSLRIPYTVYENVLER